MILQHIEYKLTILDLLPAFRTAITTVIEQGTHDHHARLLHRLPLDVFGAIRGEGEDTVLPFVAAWVTLHTALLRLDHLQDGDPEAQALPTSPHIGASYNLVFAAYVLANALLDDLDEQAIPARRLLRLRRLWNECVLAGASGQHEDLLHANPAADATQRLDQYQQMAHAKSGALFALAFAGAAILATDDTATISACRFSGNIFGALLQLSDDLLDRDKQCEHPGFTIHQAYNGSGPHRLPFGQMDDGTVCAYVQHIQKAYLEQVEHVLAQVTVPRLCAYLRQLFNSQFGSRS